MSPARTPRKVRTSAEAEYARQHGAWVAEHRKARGLSTKDLGSEIGVCASAIKQWEAGETLPNLYNGELLRLFFGPRKPRFPLAAAVVVLTSLAEVQA